MLFIRQGGDSYLSYNGPFVVNSQVTQSPSQGVCTPDSKSLRCFRLTEQGYPDGFTSSANFSTVNTKTVSVQRDIRSPYVQTWHFTIQRELAQDLVLDVGYSGNHSVADGVTADMNQARPNLPGQSIPVKAAPSEYAVRLHRFQFQCRRFRRTTVCR